MLLKKYNKLLRIIIIFLSALSITGISMAEESSDISFPSYAPGGQQTKNKEVVFLLDVSGSMKTNDANRFAIDSIAQLIYALPTDYKVGFVSYNAEVTVNQRLLESNQRNQIMELAEAIKYAGYSNAGAGLSQAVEMLLTDSSAEKSIVMLSDGEILMPNDAATVQSLTAYQSATEQAFQNGIKIHVIGLGNGMEDTENSIFASAVKTNGGVYYTPKAVGIQQAIDAILNDRLQIKQTTAAIVNTDGGIETLSIELPFTHASKLRILLTASSAIKNLNANFQADSAKQINGERYTLIEINKPKSSSMDLSFAAAAGSQVRITLIPEYQVVPEVKVTYIDSIPEDEAAVTYDREATMVSTFHDAENQNVQLWTQEYFNYSKLPVQIGNKTKKTALESGEILIKEQVKQDMTEQISFDYSNLAVNVLGIHEVEVTIEGPPALPVKEPEPEPDPPYALITVGVLAVLGVVSAIWFAKRPKPVPIPPDDKPEPGKYSYVGKLNIYITRTQSGYDIPPLSYNLFRLPSTKVISLNEVLESCGVKEQFEGADRIYLKSGAGRSLILTNNSDCTIMKSREILMKKKSYQLSVDTKVDVTFEDEVSELTFQYKDLKPSEMW